MKAEELKILRKNKKLTQKELADAIGVYSSHISQWENGKYKISKVYSKILDNFFNV